MPEGPDLPSSAALAASFNHVIERTATLLLRSTRRGISDARRALHRSGRRQSLSLDSLLVAPISVPVRLAKPAEAAFLPKEFDRTQALGRGLAGIRS